MIEKRAVVNTDKEKKAHAEAKAAAAVATAELKQHKKNEQRTKENAAKKEG